MEMTKEKKIRLEGAKVYGPQDYEVVDKMKILEEENKKLKEKVSELEDVSKDYDLLSKDFIALGEENKKLKEELGEYKKMFEDHLKECYIKNTAEFLDKKFGFMGEDTLQELRDIGEI